MLKSAKFDNLNNTYYYIKKGGSTYEKIVTELYSFS